MFLVDFVKERKIEYITVYSWLKRNNFLDKQSQKIDGKLWLDEKTVQVLSKKYPLAIEKDNNTQRQLIEAQQKIIHLQELLVEAQPKLLLMEQQKNDIDELKQELKNANARLQLAETENKNLIYQKEVEYERSAKTIEQLKQSLTVEKEKTWWDKLRKR